ncbi:MAG TPA: hypothetical protein VJT49_14895 [Amycolatopsis sp.]|uniref:hypothetical protein n=1 Tax=Amycolatopsis sp. TaxID=37632 RepID=UPI002B493FD2|nr:hypothetical protein [Amycolatopsis sp.]HKS46366.1 hypothetical protein [Amycolatopsis sp.]
MKTALARAKKAIGALLGGATGVGVAAILHAAHLDVAPELATTIAGLLAALGTYLAPANAAKE